jgi:hypothetical protein
MSTTKELRLARAAWSPSGLRDFRHNRRMPGRFVHRGGRRRCSAITFCRSTTGRNQSAGDDQEQHELEERQDIGHFRYAAHAPIVLSPNLLQPPAYGRGGRVLHPIQSGDRPARYLEPTHKFGREVLQQDQTMSARRHALRKACHQLSCLYPACINQTASR